MFMISSRAPLESRSFFFNSMWSRKSRGHTSINTVAFRSLDQHKWWILCATSSTRPAKLIRMTCFKPARFEPAMRSSQYWYFKIQHAASPFPTSAELTSSQALPWGVMQELLLELCHKAHDRRRVARITCLMSELRVSSVRFSAQLKHCIPSPCLAAAMFVSFTIHSRHFS